MSISISEGQARLIYLDYHTRGNTMGTTAMQMGAIVSQYADKIHSWQASVDSNQYEWDDSDYDQYIDDGWEMGEEATGGHTRKDQAGDAAHAAGDAVFSVAGAVGGFVGGKIAGNAASIVVGEASKSVAKKAAEEAAKKAAEEAVKSATTEAAKKTAEEAAKKTAEETAKQTAKTGAKNISAIIAIGIGIVTAAAYWIKKPNKEGAKACEKMTTELANAQGALQNSQAEMENTRNNMIKLSDEASLQNDNTNAEIKGNKDEQSYYLRIYKSLKAKMDSGKELTADEKSLYKIAASKINGANASINSLVEENSLVITDIHDNMAGLQLNYDYAAETMGEVQGMTEYTASFDKQTRTLSYVEGAAQSLNAGSTALAASRLILTSGIAWWNYAIAALGLGAAASSGVAAGQQFKFASTAGDTIETREATEGINDATQEVYDVEIDNYAVLMGGVETLETFVPEEMPTADTTITSGNTAAPKTDEKPKKVSEEK